MESLISFFIYGNAIQCRQGGIPHNYKICRDIGLVNSNFRTDEIGVREIGTGVLEPCAVYGIKYTPGFDASSVMEKDYVSNCVRIDQIISMCKGLTNVSNAADLICSSLLKLIITASLESNRQNLLLKVSSTQTYHMNVRHTHSRIMSASEFVQMLFSTRNFRIGHSGILFVINLIRTEVECAQFENIRIRLVNYMQNIMFREESTLMFPLPQQREVAIIAPIDNRVDHVLQQKLICCAWKCRFRCVSSVAKQCLTYLAHFIISNPESKQKAKLNNLFDVIETYIKGNCSGQLHFTL